MNWQRVHWQVLSARSSRRLISFDSSCWLNFTICVMRRHQNTPKQKQTPAGLGVCTCGHVHTCAVESACGHTFCIHSKCHILNGCGYCSVSQIVTKWILRIWVALLGYLLCCYSPPKIFQDAPFVWQALTIVCQQWGCTNEPLQVLIFHCYMTRLMFNTCSLRNKRQPAQHYWCACHLWASQRHLNSLSLVPFVLRKDMTPHPCPGIAPPISQTHKLEALRVQWPRYQSSFAFRKGGCRPCYATHA